MQLEAGTRLGHYEILSSLGAGGMGEVYRAKDTKLGREVAIKLLLGEVSQDAERLARFEREARVLASLNHNNIATLHGFEKDGDTSFLVMELVEGETLADRIKRGAIPVEEALPLFLQIAEGLEAAHEKGVIHRDLKPANIKVTDDGNVKILDFGLAKAMAAEPDATAAASMSMSPTLTLAATQRGEILGTAAYMAPEQARGLTVDKRADIWAFGVCLFEALAGKRLFEGEDASITLASVLKSDPDWERLPDDTPRKLRELLRRCLSKDPRQRLHDIADARIELEQDLANPPELWVQSGAEAVRTWPRSFLVWMAASVVVTALLAATAGWIMSPDEPGEISRFAYDLPEGQRFGYMGFGIVALSPDSRQFVYFSSDGLYLRSMAELNAHLIPGSEGFLGYGLFFSPDGEWVGYVDRDASQLQKISSRGGRPIPLSSVSVFSGASWSTDGTIVFGDVEGISSVPEDGGTRQLLVLARDGEVVDSPRVLPDGDSLLFSVTMATGFRRWDEGEIVVESISSGNRKVLVRGGRDARYVPTGHLIYAQGDALLAVPFDLNRLEVTGPKVQVVSGVLRPSPSDPARPTGTAQYGVSDQGTLVYIAGDSLVETTTDRTLGLVDRNGNFELLDVRPLPYVNPRLSGDGQVAVETIANDGASAIWIYDVDDNRAIRQLTQEGNNGRPIWTPDGKRVTFSSDRDGTWSIWWQPADGSGVADRLTTAEEGTEHWPTSWSPDGRTLAFTSARSGNYDNSPAIWTLSLDQPAEPELFYDFPGSPEDGALFSPDGNWLAYWSRESGDRNEVWVQPFPRTGANKHQLTQDEGTYPMWSPDGRNIYYRRTFGAAAATPELMEIDVDTGPPFGFGNERTLAIADFLIFNWHRDYDITPDGRFLMVFPVDLEDSGERARPRINIVLNWFEELKRLVPTD